MPANENSDRESYFVAVNRGAVRIYLKRKPVGQTTPALDVVDAVDLPFGKQSYSDNDTDQAGRFPSTPGIGGGSIDERLPMQREQERRTVSAIAERIGSFLAAHPQAEWSLAAAPDLQKPVLEELPIPARQQLKTTVAKDLVNLPLPELVTHAR